MLPSFSPAANGGSCEHLKGSNSLTPDEYGKGKDVRRQLELLMDVLISLNAFQRTRRYDPETLMKLVHEVRQLRVPHKISNRIEEHNAGVLNEIDPGADCPVLRAQVRLLSWGILCCKIRRTSALLHDIRTEAGQDINVDI